MTEANTINEELIKDLQENLKNRKDDIQLCNLLKYRFIEESLCI
jgi:hypothetical protein